MTVSAVGSDYEMSLRILLMLNELCELDLDEQQIGAIDYIAVYAADFELLDENLHGYNNYRYSEYPARKQMISNVLRGLVLDNYIRLLPTLTGYTYSILDSGKLLCKSLSSNYAKEYILAVRAVLKKFGDVNANSMIKEINRLTIQSLQEVEHE